MSSDRRTIARAGLREISRERGMERWIDAHGTSMLPTIRPGDRILVAVGRQPERLGQVVIVERGGHDVAHRLVAGRPGAPAARWVTKGDGETFPDAGNVPPFVVGVVLGVAGRGGSVRRRGFDGPTARWIALASRLGGGAARRSRRLCGRMPGPLGDLSLRVLLPLTRVPTRLISAPWPWLNQETRAEGR